MSGSPFAVRQVDPAAERASILAILRRNLPDAGSPERLEWLYLTNPNGPALIWLAEDAHGPFGIAAAHPRRVRINGAVVPMLCLGDFAVDERHRGHGVALALLCAAHAPVHAGRYAFSLGFPNKTMRGVWARMGHRMLAPTERWTRPVSVGPLARRKLGNGRASAIVAAGGNLALRLRDAVSRPQAGVEVELHRGPCGQEFDALDARRPARHKVVGVRDGAYLEWRYRRNVLWPHHILCARDNGRLVGYAVLRHDRPTALSLVDLFGDDDAGMRRRLVAAAIDCARRHGAAALDVEVLAGSGSAQTVRSLGFVRREDHLGPGLAYPAASPLAATLAAARNWWLMGGDRDV